MKDNPNIEQCSGAHITNCQSVSLRIKSSIIGKDQDQQPLDPSSNVELENPQSVNLKVFYIVQLQTRKKN